MRQIVTLVVMFVGAGSLSIPSAQVAATPMTPCRVGYVSTVESTDFSAARIPLDCEMANPNVIGGMSYYSPMHITITAGPGLNTTVYQETLLHEVTHQTDWHTTDTDRSTMYKYLGIITNGHDGKTNVGWNGKSVKEWEKLPEERLAESVVKCTTHIVDYPDMALVSYGQCNAFLKAFHTAYNDAPKPFRS